MKSSTFKDPITWWNIKRKLLWKTKRFHLKATRHNVGKILSWHYISTPPWIPSDQLFTLAYKVFNSKIALPLVEFKLIMCGIMQIIHLVNGQALPQFLLKPSSYFKVFFIWCEILEMASRQCFIMDITFFKFLYLLQNLK